jgi:hypothetical protein
MSALAAAALLLALAPADVQTRRLAGLARVWGQMKYVHPAMATSRIDWDAALICRRFAEATRFERAVLDLRSPTGRRPGWNVQNAIVKCASRLLSQDVTLSPARFLTHGFYMMQSVTGGAGGGLGPWDSGLKVVSGGSVRGEGARTPRLAFIVNHGTADLHPLLMGCKRRASQTWCRRENRRPPA